MVARLRLPRRRRNRILLFAALGLIGSLIGTAMAGSKNAPDVAAQPLKTFHATGFDIDLPCTPKPAGQTQSTAVGTLTVTYYGCAGGTDAYGVGTTTVPPGRTLDMTAGANGAAASMSGTVTGLTTTTYQGRPAADFRVPDATKESKKLTVFIRIVNAGTTIFQLEYLKEGNNISTPPAQWPTFLASLHIT